MSISKEKSLARRMVAAGVLSEHYNIKPSAVFLMFTLPTLASKSISERCEAVGLTEEEYLVIANQAGFMRFVHDYRDALKVGTYIQAMEKVSEGMQRGRYDVEGVEDFTLETKVMDYNSRAGQVVVQNNSNTQNNFFEQARQRVVDRQVEVGEGIAAGVVLIGGEGGRDEVSDTGDRSGGAEGEDTV